MADWGDLADTADGACDPLDSGHLKHLRDDDFIFVTHSLGKPRPRSTRWNISVAGRRPAPIRPCKRPRLCWPARIFVSTCWPTNLPLLELGQPRAEVRGQIDAYCRPDGADFDRRIFGGLFDRCVQ